MAKTYLEKRIVRAGTELCKRRIDQKGTPITAEDLKNLKVRTISPALQTVYTVIGLTFIVFGVWVHTELRNMAFSFVPVLAGFANIAFAAHGRPRKVEELSDQVDLMALSTDIVKRFVSEMDAKRSPGTGA